MWSAVITILNTGIIKIIIKLCGQVYIPVKLVQLVCDPPNKFTEVFVARNTKGGIELVN